MRTVAGSTHFKGMVVVRTRANDMSIENICDDFFIKNLYIEIKNKRGYKDFYSL